MSSPILRRSQTGIRPQISTSWLKNLVNAGNASPSPLEPMSGSHKQGASPSPTISRKNSFRDAQTVGFASNVARASRELPVSAWAANLISANSQNPSQARLKKLLTHENTKKLKEWVSDLVPNPAPNLQEPLKQAINGLIDRAFQPEQHTERPATPPYIYELSLNDLVLKRINNKPIKLKQISKLNKAQEAINSFPVNKLRQRRTASWIGGKNKQESLNFSQFGDSRPGHTFAKEQRSIDFAHRQSPGPAHYSHDRSSLRRTPSASFGSETAPRNSFLNLAETPGPAGYFPSKHFVSK